MPTQLTVVVFVVVVVDRDDMPHVPNSELSTNEVIDTVKNLTILLATVFPNHTVYPALGNHDYHPKHLMPPKPNKVYSAVGDLWSRWLPQDAVTSFKKGVVLVSMVCLCRQVDHCKNSWFDTSTR